ncbi:MAG: hypothetical protein QOJ13_360 [Gaiellales bacterium]|nr:hypothetical protein [Gaiellales bacterium]
MYCGFGGLRRGSLAFMAEGIVVGTRSWADAGLADEWYPSSLPASQRLAWYARHFVAVEGDDFFAGFPDSHEVDRWAHITPPEFSLSLQLPRLLARHAAPVSDLPPDLRVGARVSRQGRVMLEPLLEQEVVRRTLESVEPLVHAGKLSAFVLALAPAFEPRSHSLLELRPTIEGLRPHPVAVEFSHGGWLEDDRRDETLGLLGDMGAALVCTDTDAVTLPSLAYLRAEGPWDGDDELDALGDRAAALAEDATEVRVMFDNADGAGPRAAERFRERMRGRALAAA